MSELTLEIVDCNNWVRRVYEKDTTGLALRNLFSTAFNSKNPIIYVFDGVNGKESRRLLYPEYKFGRLPTPDAFYIQLELFKLLIACTNKLMICIPGREADDVIATIVKRRSPGLKILIHSNDGDYIPLLNEDVSMTDVSKKLKDVKTSEIRLFKTLVGDTSDYIKGILKFGDKSWLKLSDQQKKNWTDALEANNMGMFKPEDLGITDTQWLWSKTNWKTLNAYWQIVNFIEVPQDLIDAHTVVGTPSMVGANAILKTIFQ